MDDKTRRKHALIQIITRLKKEISEAEKVSTGVNVSRYVRTVPQKKITEMKNKLQESEAELAGLEND